MLNRRVVVIPRSLVITNRIIWSAMLAGQVATAATLAFVTPKGNRPPPALTPPAVLAVTGALLAVAIVSVVVMRARGFRGATTDQAIHARYGTRLVVAMAPLEGASFTAMILGLVTGHAMPAGILAVVAFAIQLTLLPPAEVSVPA